MYFKSQLFLFLKKIGANLRVVPFPEPEWLILLSKSDDEGLSDIRIFDFIKQKHGLGIEMLILLKQKHGLGIEMSILCKQKHCFYM